ncbi:MAG: DUF4065 domain-containing protein [Selenomonadaceae bacterium]|nr:DUF4065 domain-containing protein [Selenomonadaceae bacterium]
MVSVFDVAKYILEKQGRMSTWKLQKLCYYSQAWHYTWTERRLIEEEFQAWRNGPVCPELFTAHKGMFMIDATELSKGDSSKLDADEKDSVDVVLKEYGDREPYDLRTQSHSEAPWINARGNLPEDASSDVVITVEDMGAYYGSLIYGQEV